MSARPERRARLTPPAIPNTSDAGGVAAGRSPWDAVIAQACGRQYRVLADSLLPIPAAAREHALLAFVDAHPHLALAFRGDPPRLEPERYADMRRLAQCWQELLAAQGDATRATTSATQIIEQLCRLVGLVPLARRAYGGWVGYLVEARAMRLGVPSRFPIIVSLRPRVRHEDLVALRRLMLLLNALSFFALVVIPGKHDDLPQGAKAEQAAVLRGGADDLIVLGLRDLETFCLASDPMASLLAAILQQIDLGVVSPYVTSGPAPEAMLFGRDYELKLILRTLQDGSYAVVGGRKMGKTSLLMAIERLARRGGALLPFYVDCHGVVDYDTFWSALALATGASPETREPEDIRRAVARVRATQAPVVTPLVLLLDEADQLVRFDLQHGGRLFRAFRTVSSEGGCRFVFGGERVLWDALNDPLSPLYSAWRTLRLGCLSPGDVARMIGEPMADLGITLDPADGVVREVVDLSACHPNLVQVICHRLLLGLSGRTQRVIVPADVEAIRYAVDYPDLFLDVVWGNASDLERLISVRMVDAPAFDVGDVRRSLAACGRPRDPAEIRTALGHLELTGLVRRQGMRYEHAMPVLARLLRHAGLRETLEQSLIESLAA